MEVEEGSEDHCVMFCHLSLDFTDHKHTLKQPGLNCYGPQVKCLPGCDHFLEATHTNPDLLHAKLRKLSVSEIYSLFFLPVLPQLLMNSKAHLPTIIPYDKVHE